MLFDGVTAAKLLPVNCVEGWANISLMQFIFLGLFDLFRSGLARFICMFALRAGLTQISAFCSSELFVFFTKFRSLYCLEFNY